MVPFCFTLPQYLPIPETLPDQLARLPPSLDAGEPMFDNCGQPCMQPLVVYAVRSLAVVTIPGCPKSAQVHQSRKFELISLHDPAPLLEQADFPNEFKPHSTTVLRKRQLASSIGELCAIMEEPEPLIVSSCGVPAPAKAWIKLCFRPSRTLPGREDQRC